MNEVIKQAFIHQKKLIEKRIDPNNFKPLKRYYFLWPEFEVLVEPTTKRLYFERMTFRQLLKAVLTDLKFIIAMYIFLGYNRVSKRYPKKYLKKYNQNKNG